MSTHNKNQHQPIRIGQETKQRPLAGKREERLEELKRRYPELQKLDRSKEESNVNK